MEITANAPLIDHLLQAINAHDPDRIAGFYAADYEGLDVSRAARQHGPHGVREDMDGWFRAFPDLRFVSREVMAQHGRIVLYWTAEGTHQGAFLSVPPTRRHIEVCGFSLLAVQRGKIVRGLHLWDMAGLLRAMKLLPDLPGPQPVSQADLFARFLMHL